MAGTSGRSDSSIQAILIHICQDRSTVCSDHAGSGSIDHILLVARLISILEPRPIVSIRVAGMWGCGDVECHIGGESLLPSDEVMVV